LWNEAHCALNWGDTFREAYSHIRRKLRIFSGIPQMALTATASISSVQKISSYLGLATNARMIFKREGQSNLFLAVSELAERGKIVQMLLNELMTKGKKAPKTVVFLRDRNAVADLWSFFYRHLDDTSLVDMYMSSTPDRVKGLAATDFKVARSTRRLLVATSAFGLGVDCRNVSRVVHLDPPHSFDDYVQQIGRAGRDGQLAAAILVTDPKAKCDDAMKKFMSLSPATCRRHYIASYYMMDSARCPADTCCDLCKRRKK